MPGDDESENAGDDSDSGKEAGEMEEDQDEDELAAGGVTAPPDVMAAHHEDDGAHEGHDMDGENSDSCESMASSGMEDIDLSDDDGEQDETSLVPQADVEGKKNKEVSGPAAAAASRLKLYDQSPEWKQLLLVEQEQGVSLVKIPPVVGAGVSRHASKCYWSARYPNVPSKAVQWSAFRSPMHCLTKCLRHVIKEHLSACPHEPEMHAYKMQLQNLADYDKA